MTAIDVLFRRYYYDRASFVDGTTQFHRLCRQHIPDGSTILEIGAGPSNPTSHFLSTLGRVTGLDVTPELEGNKYLSDRHVFDGHLFPFASATFDACVTNYVLEHIPDPEEHFREVKRVLKPNGVYCFRTPNLFHYVAIASRCLPHFVHLFASNRLRGLPKDSHPPYPTYYRANTRHTIANLAKRANLEVLHSSAIEPEPSYGRSSVLLFYPMLAWERLVNSYETLVHLRANLLAVFKA